MNIRTDAPAPCGCPIQWVDGEHGPRAQPCACSGQAPGRSDGKSILDQAQEKADAEARAAHAAGPPTHVSTVVRDGCSNVAPGKLDELGHPLDARNQAEAGPPACARVRK